MLGDLDSVGFCRVMPGDFLAPLPPATLPVEDEGMRETTVLALCSPTSLIMTCCFLVCGYTTLTGDSTLLPASWPAGDLFRMDRSWGWDCGEGGVVRARLRRDASADAPPLGAAGCRTAELVAGTGLRMMERW